MGIAGKLKSLALVAALAANSASAAVYITEFQYNGSEYIEFTNTGAAPVDMTGWSFDDDSRAAGTVDFSAFGIVAPGESFLLTEAPAATFRLEWSLPASVKIIGDNLTNFGRNDEINLFFPGNALADRLNYGDNAADTPGSIQTLNISGNPKTFAALGANDVYQWELGFDGDSYGSYTALSGMVGNPGIFRSAVVPEPATFGILAVAGLMGLAGIRRR
jgi:predicted extracellular nuclease